MEHIEGKVAFVTGGGGGIGGGMAKAFLAAGMKVVVADIAQEHLDEAASELGGHGDAVHLLRVDVADAAAMQAAAAETERVFGRVHVLCNHVGIFGQSSIDEASVEEWRAVFDANVFGMVNGLNAFLPRIKSHGEGGHVVNTSSLSTFVPLGAAMGVYGASKHAVRGMSASLRFALAPHNIGVSLLCPGLTRSRSSAGVRAQVASMTASSPAPGGAGDANAGLDPAIVGERVVQAIRGNDYYILTHPEYRTEASALFSDILAAFPKEEAIPETRRHFTDERRQLSADLRARLSDVTAA